jgi:EPS-associated MarR family transcriptional regulator
MNKKLSTEDSYYLLKEIDSGYEHTQRSLSKSLGYSLGKVNYLIKSLTEKGLIKLENFTKHNNKLGYCYVLTPQGMKEKIEITKAFIERKEAEYDRLRVEIEEAKRHVNF